MRKKMTDKHKLMAYVLSTDKDLNSQKRITQKKIADIFGVSQSTVAASIKEAGYRVHIMDLEKRLDEAKMKLLEVDGIEQLQLSDSSFESPYQNIEGEEDDWFS